MTETKKIIIRGIAFAVISISLALYEVITSADPRLLLVLGYALTFCYGVFLILTRNKRPQIPEED